MKIKFLKIWNMSSPGDEAEFPRPVAELLIKRGIAKPLADEQTKPVDEEVEASLPKAVQRTPWDKMVKGNRGRNK